MTTPWGSKTRRLARCCCLPMWQRNTLATTPALPQIVWGLPMPAFCYFVSKHIEVHTHPRRQWHMCKHNASEITTTKWYMHIGTLFPPCSTSYVWFLLCTAFSQPSHPPVTTFSFLSAPLKLCLPLLPSLSAVHHFTPHLFLVYISACTQAAWRSADRFTQDVFSSFYGQFTLNVSNEQFPTLPFPVTFPLPL